MLAQLQNVPADHLQSAVLITLAALGGLGMLATIILGIVNTVRGKKNTISPQPLEVRAVQTFVDITTWEREQAAIRDRITKLEHHYDALREIITHQGDSIEAKLLENAKESRASLGTLHRRFDAVLPVIFKLAGKMGVNVKEEES